MKTGKLVNAVILLFVPVLTISSAYAETDESFADVLVKINDFFENEQYAAYAKIIDFFVFSLLFISVYLIGVRYAFKQVNKPEKVIALVLGFMSAFLMVSQGKSVIALLPYIDLLLYTFLFIVIWLLLKGIKSKFLRFIIALMITLIAAALLSGFFESAGEFSEGFDAA